MCGIIGIVTRSNRDLASDLRGALSRLEYRGYDSAGIALVKGGRLAIEKCVGAPSENLDIRTLLGGAYSIGIGHNRWATHGKPTLLNAHPHTDEAGRIAVVHNGTILNHEELRKELMDKGVVFVSETDTEVVPHLIAVFMKEGMSMEEAFFATMSRLKGTFGIIAFHKEDQTKLYVAKDGSPIVVGISENAYYVASSVHGFMPFTDRYITLQDKEAAVLSTGGVPDMKVRTIIDKKRIMRDAQTLENMEERDLSKGEFETFMLKEIYEQPATTRATLLGRIDEKSGLAVLGGLFDYKHLLSHAKHILITGCGTAYNAGEIGAYVLERLTPISVRTEIASEGRYKELHTPKGETLVFSISQSGETSDTIEYIKELKRKEYECFGIINVVGSALAEITGKGVYTRAGSEIGVASTKAFTSQLTALYLVSLYIARSQSLGPKRGMQFTLTLESIPELMKETLLCEAVIKKCVTRYSAFTKILFLGRGIHLPIAKEASLKFKEITYLETGAYPLGELKHGPIAIIDEDALAVVILPDDELFEAGVNSIEQIKSKGGKVLLITDRGRENHPLIKKVDDVIFIPHLTDELFYPLLEIIPLQLFAYYFAKMLGRNIDKPRNLAKSVTVQ